MTEPKDAPNKMDLYGVSDTVQQLNTYMYNRFERYACQCAGG